MLLENPLHHAGADPKLPADLEDAVTAGLQFENSRLHSRVNPVPAELGPIRPRARRCLFVGVKRTSLKNAPRTAFDPTRTSNQAGCPHPEIRKALILQHLEITTA